MLSFYFQDSVGDIHFTHASETCPLHSCHVGKNTHFVWHQDIYIFISRVTVIESNQAQQAGHRWRLWRPAHCGRAASDLPTSHGSTRATTPLFHPSPTIQPAVIPSPSFSLSPITLLFFSSYKQGGGEKRREGREGSPGAVTVLSSCSSFFLFLVLVFFLSLKMYSVVSFFSFLFFFK